MKHRNERKIVITVMKILLCSYFKFPAGCAGAIRHEKLAQMLTDMGHDVLVVGLGDFNDFKTESYNNINYISLRYRSSSVMYKIIMRLRYWHNMKKIMGEYSPDCIIMDDMRPQVTVKLKRYSQKKGITLVHDSVEWYSPEQFKLGIFSPVCIKKNIVNRFLIDKSCRVIAISQYLTDYYRSKHIPCVNIPIVAAESDLVREKKLKETVNFVYAGQAGKKDYINVILSAMALLSEEERRKFQFHILGCTEEQIIQNGVPVSTVNKVRSSLVIYGRVPRSKVLDVLKESDFTILMRSGEQRYAKAGFPTKLVESLSHSTAMIANLTSDMDRYLVDGYNSFIVPECTDEALAEILRKAIDLSLEKRLQMCVNACKTVEDQLCYRYFMSELKTIIH